LPLWWPGYFVSVVREDRLASRTATVAACKRWRWATTAAVDSASDVHEAAAGSIREASQLCQADG